MKILKILGIIVLILIGVPLIVALFVPTDYGASRAIVIDRPLDEVYDFAKYLKNQNQYGKWNLMDPEMEHYYEGEDGTVGFVSGWKSDNPEVGHGEQEIIAMQEGKRIDFELRFFDPFESTDKAYMTFSEIDAGQTEVAWGFDGKMAYPMNLMVPMMGMEEMIGNDFQTGLDNLKRLLEK
ncbi:hypothetical protein GCM10009119_17430 [Algoriphagus jejuensis]|uniref:Polyketide cyclase/dehydrase/lipid transport protein n=1 Tax=Algoriphagus jejuensis TaxID=419934 RepID=A0ABP3YDE4_9BACT